MRAGPLCQRARRSARRTNSGRAELSSGNAPASVAGSDDQFGIGNRGVVGEQIGVEPCIRELDAIAPIELAGRLRRRLLALARAEQVRVDGVGEQLAEVGGRPFGIVTGSRIVVGLCGGQVARRRFATRTREPLGRRRGMRRRFRCRPVTRRRLGRRGAARALGRRYGAQRLLPRGVGVRAGRRHAGERLAALGPVRRHVAAEVEQPLERVEDFVAATATDPAFGHLELVLDDSKRRAAGGAARRQAHRQIMPCATRRAPLRPAGSSRPRVARRLQREPGSVGRAELVGLAIEDAREDQRAAVVDERRQQRREQLQRRGQDVGEDQLVAARRRRSACPRAARRRWRVRSRASSRSRPGRCRPHRSSRAPNRAAAIARMPEPQP